MTAASVAETATLRQPELDPSGSITMSYAEITRTGLFVLRALGMSFSVAERSVHTLATAEAVTGEAMRTLRLDAERIVAGAGRPAGLADLPGPALRVDAAGKSLLELGGFALDLLTAAAGDGAPAVLRIDHTFGLLYLTDIVRRAGERGLGLICAGREAPPHPWRGALLAAGPPAGTQAAGGMLGRETTPLGPVFAAAAGEIGCPPLPGPPDAPAPGTLFMAAIDLRAGGAAAFARAARIVAEGAGPPDPAAPAWWPAATWSGRLAHGKRHGLPVAKIDHAAFSALVAEAWVPTSERSRRQNG